MYAYNSIYYLLIFLKMTNIENPKGFKKIDMESLDQIEESRDTNAKSYQIISEDGTINGLSSKDKVVDFLRNSTEEVCKKITYILWIQEDGTPLNIKEAIAKETATFNKLGFF